MRLFHIVWACLFLLPAELSYSQDAQLKAERLTWAGVKLVYKNTTVFIDAVGTDLWNGKAPEGLVQVTAETSRRYALISHTHNDHFDPATLKTVLGERGYVICHESIAAHVASRGLRVISAKFYEPITRGGLVFTAIPASDGLGSSQVSWIVSSPNKRIIHAGDTLWHGQWDLIGAQYGPFDAAFMPINGAVLQREPASEIAAVMNPKQAVDASLLLRAKTLVPIHFGLQDPPYYVEVKNPLESTIEEGKRRGLHVSHLKPGDELEWR